MLAVEIWPASPPPETSRLLCCPSRSEGRQTCGVTQLVKPQTTSERSHHLRCLPGQLACKFRENISPRKPEISKRQSSVWGKKYDFCIFRSELIWGENNQENGKIFLFIVLNYNLNYAFLLCLCPAGPHLSCVFLMLSSLCLLFLSIILSNNPLSLLLSDLLFFTLLCPSSFQ